MKRAFLIVAIVFALILVAALSLPTLERWSITPPTPPLLKGLTTRGMSTNVCPARTAQQTAEYDKYELAMSAELNQRLAEHAPFGSSEDMLIRFLAAQGFVSRKPCE